MLRFEHFLSYRRREVSDNMHYFNNTPSLKPLDQSVHFTFKSRGRMRQGFGSLKLLACFQHLSPQGRNSRHCNPPTNKAIRKGEKDSLKTWTIAIRATVVCSGGIVSSSAPPATRSWRAETVVGTREGPKVDRNRKMADIHFAVH